MPSLAVLSLITALHVLAVPTPRLVPGLYDTGGRFPQMGGEPAAVNQALRAALRADQRRYVHGIRRPGASCGGIYVTSVDPGLISASTSAVSALLPATELYPCGNDGRGWLSVTVLVPSGRRVTLPQLFADPGRALPAIAHAWRDAFGRTRVGRVLLHAYPHDFRTAVFPHADFALTTHGLAIGFWQDGPTNRLRAIVDDATLRPLLGSLGRRLVAGVRRPTSIRRPGTAANPLGPAPVPQTFAAAGGRIVCRLTATAVACRRGRAGVELAAGGRIGTRLLPVGGRRSTVLHPGEWIETTSFLCMSLPPRLRCLTIAGRGFVLGPNGVRRLRFG